VVQLQVWRRFSEAQREVSAWQQCVQRYKQHKARLVGDYTVLRSSLGSHAHEIVTHSERVLLLLEGILMAGSEGQGQGYRQLWQQCMSASQDSVSAVLHAIFLRLSLAAATAAAGGGEITSSVDDARLLQEILSKLSALQQQLVQEEEQKGEQEELPVLGRLCKLRLAGPRMLEVDLLTAIQQLHSDLSKFQSPGLESELIVAVHSEVSECAGYVQDFQRQGDIQGRLAFYVLNTYLKVGSSVYIIL
jgi:hypothetical protein